MCIKRRIISFLKVIREEDEKDEQNEEAEENGEEGAAEGRVEVEQEEREGGFDEDQGEGEEKERCWKTPILTQRVEINARENVSCSVPTHLRKLY